MKHVLTIAILFGSVVACVGQEFAAAARTWDRARTGKDLLEACKALLKAKGSPEAKRKALLRKLSMKETAEVLSAVESMRKSYDKKILMHIAENLPKDQANPFFLGLLEAPCYKPGPGRYPKNYFLCMVMIEAIGHLPYASKELICALEKIAMNADSAYSTTAIDALMRLKEEKALGKVLKKMMAPAAVSKLIAKAQFFRNQPIVFEYLIDSHLKNNYMPVARTVILSVEDDLDDTNDLVKIPRYETVQPADAPRFIKALDRLLAKKNTLLKLNDEVRKYLPKNIKRLEDIRALMVKKVESL